MSTPPGKSQQRSQISLTLPRHVLTDPQQVILQNKTVNLKPRVYVFHVSEGTEAYNCGLRSGDRVDRVMEREIRKQSEIFQFLKEDSDVNSISMVLSRALPDSGATSPSKKDENHDSFFHHLRRDSSKRGESGGLKPGKSESPSLANSLTHRKEHRLLYSTRSPTARARWQAAEEAAAILSPRNRPVHLPFTSASSETNSFGADRDGDGQESMSASVSFSHEGPLSEELELEDTDSFASPSLFRHYGGPPIHSPVLEEQEDQSQEQPRIQKKPHYVVTSPNSSRTSLNSRRSNLAQADNDRDFWAEERENTADMTSPRSPSSESLPGYQAFALQTSAPRIKVHRKHTGSWVPGGSTDRNVPTPSRHHSVTMSPPSHRMSSGTKGGGTPGVSTGLSVYRKKTLSPRPIPMGQAPITNLDESGEVVVPDLSSLPSADHTMLDMQDGNRLLTLFGGCVRPGEGDASPGTEKLPHQNTKTRRASDDPTLMKHELQSLEQLAKIKSDCCIRSTEIKPSEFLRSHTIRIINIRSPPPALKVERRYVSINPEENLNEVTLQLSDIVMKPLSNKRTLRIQENKENGRLYFIMFESNEIFRSWQAVVEAYIPPQTIPQHPSSASAETSRTKKLSTGDFLAKYWVGKFGSRLGHVSSSAGGMQSNSFPQMSSLPGQQSNIIPLNKEEMCVVNASLLKCTPSPTCKEIPLFLQVSLDVIEQFYNSVEGLYRVSGKRAIVDKAVTTFSRPVDKIDMTELPVLFSHPKELANFMKLFMRSMTPRLFNEETFAAFQQHLTVPTSSDVQASADATRSIDVNMDGVKTCLRQWRNGMSFTPNTSTTNTNNNHQENEKEMYLEQVLSFMCLKRFCRHIAVLGNFGCDRAQRLSVDGLAAMFACNWHSSSQPQIIACMNRLVSVLAQHYEWFFDDSLPVSTSPLQPPSTSTTASLSSLQDKDLERELTQSTESPMEDGSSPGVIERVGTKSSLTSSEGESGLLNAGVGGTSNGTDHVDNMDDDVIERVVAVVKQAFQLAREQAADYSHLLHKEPTLDVPPEKTPVLPLLTMRKLSDEKKVALQNGENTTTQLKRLRKPEHPGVSVLNGQVDTLLASMRHKNFVVEQSGSDEVDGLNTTTQEQYTALSQEIERLLRAGDENHVMNQQLQRHLTQSMHHSLLALAREASCCETDSNATSALPQVEALYTVEQVETRIRHLLLELQSSGTELYPSALDSVLGLLNTGTEHNARIPGSSSNAVTDVLPEELRHLETQGQQACHQRAYALARRSTSTRNNSVPATATSADSTQSSH